MEAVFTSPRSHPETEAGHHRLIQTRGAIMLVSILNAIYREFLRASLSGAKAARGF
jgi:hypothetical protein